MAIDPHAELAVALAQAEKQCPPGTRGRDVSYHTEGVLRFDLITEYEPELACGYPPILRSEGSVDSTQAFSSDGIFSAVTRLVERHNKEWAFIHGPEVAAAAEQWRVQQAAA